MKYKDDLMIARFKFLIFFFQNDMFYNVNILFIEWKNIYNGEVITRVPFNLRKSTQVGNNAVIACNRLS